jgi:uncharacterized phiE125 gp8 family phage protein
VLPAPLQALAAARVFDAQGDAQAIDPQTFVVDTVSAPGMVSFPPWSAPAPGRATAGIELDIVVGYGDAATDAPEPLRLAIRQLVAHWYENRGVESRRIEARGIDPEIFNLPLVAPRRRRPRQPVVLGPAHAMVLDLPTLPNAPADVLAWLAVFANPWPGPMVV